MHCIGTLIAYFGPETIVPATSILAAITAALLTFGGWMLRPIRVILRAIVGKRR